jgi:hypothetical protein
MCNPVGISQVFLARSRRSKKEAKRRRNEEFHPSRKTGSDQSVLIRSVFSAIIVDCITGERKTAMIGDRLHPKTKYNPDGSFLSGSIEKAFSKIQK